MIDVKKRSQLFPGILALVAKSKDSTTGEGLPPGLLWQLD